MKLINYLKEKNMKKLIVVLLMLFVASAVFAEIQLGTFPIGQWLDPNYNAVWDFATNNIRILDTNGKVLYNFSDKTINDFRIFLDGLQPGISFSCPEAERSYRFIKPLSNSDVILEIDRRDQVRYTVHMPKQ